MFLRYLSLFSGIGGFEKAIQNLFSTAECIGYSEIKPSALSIYEHHYPDHINLGNVEEITEEKILELGKCDLVVAGFPCTNLSSLAHIRGDPSGLEGKKSGLFFEMLRILKILKKNNSSLHVVIENNASMSKINQKIITENLIEVLGEKVRMTKIDSAWLGVQTRKRLYWTTFPVSDDFQTQQTWEDVLIPSDNLTPISEKYVDCLNRTIPSKTCMYKHKIFFDGEKFQKIEHNEFTRSRWQCSFHSDTTDEKLEEYTYPVGKSRPVTASFGNHNVLVDRRVSPFIIRMFEIEEIERLFGLPTGYTAPVKARNKKIDCLGNSVVVYVIEHILRGLDWKRTSE